MEELELTKALYVDILSWMKPKYSVNTVKQYSHFLHKISKRHNVLNRQTMKTMSKSFKHQNQRAVLSMINEYCYDNDIDFSIKIPKMKKQPSKLPDILSASEIKLMIESAPKPYDLCIRCLFNMGAGLRISEIIKFSWNHIRWIDWLRNKDNYGVAVIKSGKGSKDRIVNIPKKLMHDLYAYAEEERVLNEYRIPSSGMIFHFGGKGKEMYKKELYSSDNEQWKNEYVRHCYNYFRDNVLRKHCEKALNKKIKIHSLRHSRSTYLYEVEKVPIEKIQILLGHASINTTMLYTRINPLNVFELMKETKEV